MPFIIVLGVFGSLLRILYGVLAPYRDSGDLAASAFSLGIAHPPGYAFYTLLTKAGMALLPFANPAYRANLLSALWTALAAAVLYQVLRKFSERVPALFAVLLWAFLPSVVQLSLVSEMYTLNALFCSLILYAAFSGAFTLAFFLAGIGSLNHPTIVFCVPGLLLAAWMSDREAPAREKIVSLIGHGLFAALGFSLLLYYPIRSFQNPAIDWGDPENLRALWRLLTRADYGGLKLHPEESKFAWTAGGILDQLSFFLKAEWREMRWWGSLAALGGIGIGLRRFFKREAGSPLLVLCFTTVLVSGPLFFILSNLPIGEETTMPILEPYLMMANLFGAVFFALGADFLWKRAEPAGKLRTFLFGALIIASVAALWPHSRRRDFTGYDYGRNILKTLPLGSSIFDPDDTTAFTVSYLQAAEGRRKDVVPLMTLRTLWGYRQLKERVPQALPAGDFKSAQEFIPALLLHHLRAGIPLFADHPSKFPSGIPQVPAGLLTQAAECPDAACLEQRQSSVDFYIARNGFFGGESDPDFFTRRLFSGSAAAFNNIGLAFQNRREWVSAERYFREALKREPGLQEAWSNLGVSYYERGEFEKAASVIKEGLLRVKKPGPLQYHLALCYRRLNQRTEAREALLRAVEDDPSNVMAWNEIGLMFLEEKLWKEAAPPLERCIAIQRDYAPALFNLGLVYREVGRQGEASIFFKRYLELVPNDADAGKIRGWIAEALK